MAQVVDSSDEAEEPRMFWKAKKFLIPRKLVM